MVDLQGLSDADRLAALEVLGQIDAMVKSNPLEVFDVHPANGLGRRPQLEFLAACTRVVAAFAGNRFGKSTIGVVKALCQVLDDRWVPAHLRAFRQVAAPCHGWMLCPSEAKIEDSLLPALKKWCPAGALKGGNFGKAYNGDKMILTFSNGSTIGFKTYKQDSATLGGADLDFVLYDEPPPRSHRNECVIRMARGVREWYAMTPVRVNVAWIRNEIWRKREDPDITVVQGSIHENPTLAPDEVKFILDQFTDVERASRESGAFMDLSGLVYARFESAVVPAPNRAFVGQLDLVVGIDPGIRNAAFVFGGFDHHGVDWIFDELLIQDGTPSLYAEGIDRVLGRWGLARPQVLFVIDPAARQRSQATGDTVQSELTRVGVFTADGNRDREAGQQQIRDRIRHGRLKVSEACLGLRDDAESFAYPLEDLTDQGVEEDRGAADDSPFHRLATLRYQVMLRPWYPSFEDAAPDRLLGWQPGKALKLADLKLPQPVPPMGAMS